MRKYVVLGLVIGGALAVLLPMTAFAKEGYRIHSKGKSSRHNGSGRERHRRYRIIQEAVDTFQELNKPSSADNKRLGEREYINRGPAGTFQALPLTKEPR